MQGRSHAGSIGRKWNTNDNFNIRPRTPYSSEMYWAVSKINHGRTSSPRHVFILLTSCKETLKKFTQRIIYVQILRILDVLMECTFTTVIYYNSKFELQNFSKRRQLVS